MTSSFATRIGCVSFLFVVKQIEIHPPFCFYTQLLTPPTRKVTDFFLYKAFKFAKTPRHLRHRCSKAGKQFIRIFGRSGIFLGTSFRYFHGNRWTMDEKRIVHFLRGSLRKFSEKMFKRGIFNKRGLIKLP